MLLISPPFALLLPLLLLLLLLLLLHCDLHLPPLQGRHRAARDELLHLVLGQHAGPLAVEEVLEHVVALRLVLVDVVVVGALMVVAAVARVEGRSNNRVVCPSVAILDVLGVTSAKEHGGNLD